MVSKQEVRGKVRNLKGRLKEAAGIVTGNPELEEEGADQRVDGALEEGMGKARRKVGEALQDLGRKVKK
jgi:uncharacterized protein YjbJ (UPF0337 family)